ncbi:MAG: LPS export ABC transporter permease LptF [Gammaproteobacteria bacterium]|nr:LPS export ABC transporter permease LptF [Gammaproteobacteria bacterium]
MPTIRQLFRSYFSVIDRYLLREFFLSLIAVTSVLWLIFIATRFARYLAQAAVGNLPGEIIFTLLGYSSLSALHMILPIGALLAVMLAMGRMSSDSELTVMAACGITERQIVNNVLIFSSVIAFCIGLLSLFIVPLVTTDGYKLEQNAKMAADTSGLVAGNFKEGRNGDWTFYSQGLTEDKQGMENVFIEIHRNDKPMVFRAESGHFEIDSENGNKYLILENGFRYQGEAGDQDFIIAQFASHSLLVEKGEEQQVRERHKALPTSELWHRGGPVDIAEIQWRVSAIVMTIILCLLAIKLANAGPRKGRYAGFFSAILVYIIYSNLLGVTRAWVSKGVIAPLFGAVWVHLLMMIIVIVLFNRHKLRHLWLQYQHAKGQIQ